MMFIRFSLPKMFRLRGRSRKTETQRGLPSSSSDTHTHTHTLPLSTVTTPKAPSSDESDRFPSSDLIIVQQPSPERHVIRVSSSSLSHHSDSSDSEMMEIPIIVIEPAQTTTVATLPPVPPKTKSSLLSVESPPKQRSDRSKSVMFVTSSPDPASAAHDKKKPRPATMGARPTKRKIEFIRRNSKRESQSQSQLDFLRNSKRASEITLVGELMVDSEGKLESEVESENRRNSQRESKRVSKMSSKMPKRQSRWQREINDPNTQEVLRALCALN